MLGPPKTAFGLASTQRRGNFLDVGDNNMRDSDTRGGFGALRRGEADTERLRGDRNKMKNRTDGDDSEGWSTVKPRKSFGADGAQPFQGRMGAIDNSPRPSNADSMRGLKAKDREDRDPRDKPRGFENYVRDRDGEREDKDTWRNGGMGRVKNENRKDHDGPSTQRERNGDKAGNGHRGWRDRDEKPTDKRWDRENHRHDNNPEWAADETDAEPQRPIHGPNAMELFKAEMKRQEEEQRRKSAGEEASEEKPPTEAVGTKKVSKADGASFFGLEKSSVPASAASPLGPLTAPISSNRESFSSFPFLRPEPGALASGTAAAKPPPPRKSNFSKYFAKSAEAAPPPVQAPVQAPPSSKSPPPFTGIDYGLQKLLSKGSAVKADPPVAAARPPPPPPQDEKALEEKRAFEQIMLKLQLSGKGGSASAPPTKSALHPRPQEQPSAMTPQPQGQQQFRPPQTPQAQGQQQFHPSGSEERTFQARNQPSLLDLLHGPSRLEAPGAEARFNETLQLQTREQDLRAADPEGEYIMHLVHAGRRDLEPNGAPHRNPIVQDHNEALDEMDRNDSGLAIEEARIEARRAAERDLSRQNVPPGFRDYYLQRAMGLMPGTPQQQMEAMAEGGLTPRPLQGSQFPSDGGLTPRASQQQQGPGQQQTTPTQILQRPPPGLDNLPPGWGQPTNQQMQGQGPSQQQQQGQQQQQRHIAPPPGLQGRGPPPGMGNMFPPQGFPGMGGPGMGGPGSGMGGPPGPPPPPFIFERIPLPPGFPTPPQYMNHGGMPGGGMGPQGQGGMQGNMQGHGNMQGQMPPPPPGFLPGMGMGGMNGMNGFDPFGPGGPQGHPGGFDGRGGNGGMGPPGGPQGPQGMPPGYRRQ